MSEVPITPELMYRLLVQSVKDYAIYLLDADGVVLNWNAGAERAKGYTAAEIVGRNYACFYSEQDRANGLPRLNLELARQNGHHAMEGWRYRKDGSAFWAGIALDAIYDDDRRFVGFAKVTRDLTEQRASEQRFRHQSLHDSLTGIANRMGLVERLEAQFPEIVYGSRIALHYIDLDRFKPVNDVFGHLVGDDVLREVARRLEALAGPAAFVGRLGGDEFAIVQLGSPDGAAVADMANAIVAALNRPIQIGTKTANIGASVGVAIAPGDGSEIPDLFRSADLALYRAKHDGRNCVRFFDASMNQQALARSVLELKLRHAVDAGDFHLAYQPIVDGRSGGVTGYEALLRWVDQTGTHVSPAEFVPIAEELGLMPKLGEWVLRTACREAATWPSPLTVAVNLSATQLGDEGLADLVTSILTTTGLPAERLELEITETAVLTDLDRASATLKRLRDIGVAIALDDFGTGFSSLALVRALPLTRIKIDRSFVSDLDGHDASTAVIQCVVALCRGYGLATTAEGIETERQRDVLLACGCDTHQGYLYGRPGTVVAATAAPLPRQNIHPTSPTLE
ncbi:bifunctional diguanylate cyclase/phosphodiesterase [Aureimonas sp. AU4]|uniref:putative bifunctional diguanylate cyclase/phosphodiesterase n=1 Tax=Aureimonas sp. AU4 TaxID=1638163 RepID=UPI0007858E5C|nr:EAL domain-containing protein [Aureimonas sp. AU4]